jgi:DHA2 family multidrug resistance protein
MEMTATQMEPMLSPAQLAPGHKIALFAILAFGQFMALLDIQIVAASLSQIQAGLSAGADEIAWVQTAYLMAEVVMIPLSGFLNQALSTRWLFALSAGLFTLSSLACGLATNLETMIICRAIQGFVGGAMVPTVFATGFAMFSGPQQRLIPAILGLVSTLAPTLGPSLGGYLTDALSWHWLFFINIIPGCAITIGVILLGRIDRPNLALLARIDWLHLASLAVSLGALQYMLEEGPRHDWFQDPDVISAAWISFIGALVFFERSIFSAMPIVSLTPLANPTFVIACVLNFVIGFGLYSSTYLSPVFLTAVRNYSSQDIGATVFVAGIFMFFGAPIAARLSGSVDPRKVIAAGFSLFAFSLWLMSGITANWGFWELFAPQAVRGFSLLLCIVPAVGLSLATVPQAQLKAASGLFNLTRNLGGAVGIALVNTWLGDFTRWHALRLGEAMGANGANDGAQALGQIVASHIPDPALAALMVQGELTRVVTPMVMAQGFEDVFTLMAGLFVVALIMVPLCRMPAPAAAQSNPDAH